MRTKCLCEIPTGIVPRVGFWLLHCPSQLMNVICGASTLFRVQWCHCHHLGFQKVVDVISQVEEWVPLLLCNSHLFFWEGELCLYLSIELCDLVEHDLSQIGSWLPNDFGVDNETTKPRVYISLSHPQASDGAVLRVGSDVCILKKDRCISSIWPSRVLSSQDNSLVSFVRTQPLLLWSSLTILWAWYTKAEKSILGMGESWRMDSWRFQGQSHNRTEYLAPNLHQEQAGRNRR